MGDPAGIGGEIILRALPELCRKSIPVIVGDFRVIDQLASRLFQDRHLSFKGLGEARAGEAEFMDLGIITSDVQFGSIDPMHGHAAHSYIIEALKLDLSQRCLRNSHLSDQQDIDQPCRYTVRGPYRAACPLRRGDGLRYDDGRKGFSRFPGNHTYPCTSRAGRNHRRKGIQVHSTHRCFFERVFPESKPHASRCAA